MKSPIYLDYNATTPLDERVLEQMMPYLKDQFGNASSDSHSYGRNAAKAVSKAREQVAQVIKASPEEIYFTSGATESNNMAILGLLSNFWQNRPHVITSNVEHKAVFDVCKRAEELGAEVDFLECNKLGYVPADCVETKIKPTSRLISIMMANNEIGTINPIEEIGTMAKSRGVFFHTDAAQAFSKLEIDVERMGIDMLSISGHKIYGPKGVGALYVRKQNPKVQLKPITFGGAQEHGLRPGTLNVAGIVGLGAAAELAHSMMASESQRIGLLRDHLIKEIQGAIPGAILNGHPTERLYNNASFSFTDMSADLFALGLSGLAVSSGSACTSKQNAGSYVIKALGHDDKTARATIRIGLGRLTTAEDVNTAIEKIVAMYRKNQERGQGQRI